jgi:transposase InsO family protein
MGNTFPVFGSREKTLPWSAITVVEQRQEFVRLASQPDANVSELCRRFGISRKTGYKWLAREQLDDRSRRPHRSPARTSEQVEAHVLAVREAHPAWGGRKIAHVLERDHGTNIAPSTVTSVLHRHGLISQAASEASKAWQRFEHDRPNALWQMDFKGHFATDTRRCHPLTVLDDHSRFNIVLQALGDERRETVQQVLQSAFERYGLPERINADNGPPWGTGCLGNISTLGVWLIRIGIALTHSRPAHPQTNGKDERFHRTLVAEVLAHRHFRDLDDAQRHFTPWRHQYNFERPHEAIGMQTPANRYSASPRSMPAKLLPVEYGPQDHVRRVHDGGWINFRGREFRVGKALVGQPVALRLRADRDGAFDVYFCHQRLETIELNQVCDA